MRHVRLGRTGLQVFRLWLGTMTFGLQSDVPASVAILDRAAAGGPDECPALGPRRLAQACPRRPARARRRLRAGKARRGGCSNYAAWQVARALGRSGAQGLAADRKARLDEMTRGHRSGDDP